MEKRLQKFLKISAVEAKALAAKIEDNILALKDQGLSKKSTLKRVLKDLGWANKDIEHFVYGPPKSRKS